VFLQPGVRFGGASAAFPSGVTLMGNKGINSQIHYLRTGSMKGNPKVLEHLNHALRDELTAINQYFLHAEMAENWGYKKYSKYIKRQSIDEMKHAELLMERILFLDGTPSMEPMSLTIGKSVREMIESDLKLEHEAVASYNGSIRVCVENGDNGSRDLFVRLLKDEEGHVDWLEAQVHQIHEIGYERYLITLPGFLSTRTEPSNSISPCLRN
jgi:bacterioferritin